MNQVDSVGIVTERGYSSSREPFFEQLVGPKDLSTVWSLASPRSVPCPCQTVDEDNTGDLIRSIHIFEEEIGSVRGRLTQRFASSGAPLYWSDPVQAIAGHDHGNRTLIGRPIPFAWPAFCWIKRQ